MQKRYYSIYIDCENQVNSDMIAECEDYHVIEDYHQEDYLICISDKNLTLQQFQSQGVAVIALLSSKSTNQDFFSFPFAVECLSAIDYDYLDFVYYRAHHEAMEVCETNRLIIQEMTEHDAEVFNDIFTDQILLIMFGKFYCDIEELKEYLKSYYDNNYSLRGYGIWKISDKSSQKNIGLVGFSKENAEGDLELGYAIIREYRKLGYATEACKAVIQYAKERLEKERITAFVENKNQISRQLLENLGFRMKTETEYVLDL